MSYEVIRHSAVGGAFKFMKVVPDAVYFDTPDGNNQFVVNLGEKYQKARGNEVLTELRNKVVNKGRKIPTNELIKAAQAYITQFSSVKHSDDSNEYPDILTEDDVEIIEAPYPKNGKAEIPKRSFIYDDEDGYPAGYFDHSALAHHGILGMKWGVRRYQNADGSLTEAGRKRYGVQSSSASDIQTRKGIQRRLNDLDSAISRNKRYASNYEIRAKQYDRKELKYKNKSTSNADMKADKYGAKAEEARLKSEPYTKAIEEGQKEVDRLIKQAIDSGYTVDRIASMRSTTEGKDVLSSLLVTAGIFTVPALMKHPVITPRNILLIDDPRRAEIGSKYKVKETKAGQTATINDKKGGLGVRVEKYIEDQRQKVQESSKTSQSSSNTGTFEQRRSAYLSENKSRLLKDAKEKGTFDMEFLESNGDTNRYGEPLKGKELMDAYEKYLDDEIKRGK